MVNLTLPQPDLVSWRERLHKLKIRVTHGTLVHSFRHYPARGAVLIFAGVCLLFTMLLHLPIATASGRSPTWQDALFTAVSTVCVTGLTVVPTGVYWSHFGQLVIMLGVKVGGLGIMMISAVLALAVSRRIGLTQRMLLADDTRIGRMGEIRSLVRVVIITTTGLELAVALLLFPRFVYLYGHPSTAAWHSLFYGISAFNNAGFILTRAGFYPYVEDWLICVPLMIGAFVGSLGFPVILNILNTRHEHRRAWRNWSLHTKLTLLTSAILVLVGFAGFFLLERNNPATLGSLTPSGRILAALFAGVMPRSAGFNTLNVAQWHHATWTFMDALMFIGGGSVSTAGGIKVTTLAIILLAIRAEARGDRDIEAFGRRIPSSLLRVAMAIVCLGGTIVFVAVMILLEISGHTLDVVLFEALGAYATTGLSTGLTEMLPMSGRWVLIVLMFLGRIGTVTFAAALATRDRKRVVRYPEERPILG